jgi:prepilin-type N-terminal cleavage/methylation domain-containing protein
MKDERGFTLMELATVVGVLGLLASFAIPGYRAIILRAHAAEAQVWLQSIADAELRYYRDHGKFLACGAEPAGDPPKGTRRPFEAVAPGWKDLGFRAEGLVRYRYQVLTEGTTFKALAQGDLDGDGRASTYTLRGDTFALTAEDAYE